MVGGIAAVRAAAWLVPVSVALLLAGCAGGAGTTPMLGYQYHDGNHIGGNAPSSAEARYNAAHGTWLWPPAESDIPG